MPRRAIRRARSPSPGTASGPPDARSASSGSPPSSSRRGAMTRRRSAPSSAPRSTASSRKRDRRRAVPEPLPQWVGRDEFEGIPVQPRKDLRPPPHWRLEAIAATERPRSLRVGEDGSRAVVIQDRDTSDVWGLDLLHACPVPERLTTGRDPMPFWEDTEPRLSPDGSQVAYADEGHVWLVPAAGGPPRKLLEASSPLWIDDATLLVATERDDTTRLAVVGVADPWPRRLVRLAGDLEDRGDEWGPAVSPDRTEAAYVFTPRDDLKRSEIRVADVATGEVRAVTGTPGMADRAPA